MQIKERGKIRINIDNKNVILLNKFIQLACIVEKVYRPMSSDHEV